MKLGESEGDSESGPSGSGESASEVEGAKQAYEHEVVGFPLVGSDEWEDGISYLGLLSLPSATLEDPLTSDGADTVTVVSDSAPLASESDEDLTPIVLPEPNTPELNKTLPVTKRDLSVWPGLEYTLPSLAQRSSAAPAQDSTPELEPDLTQVPDPASLSQPFSEGSLAHVPPDLTPEAAPQQVISDKPLPEIPAMPEWTPPAAKQRRKRPGGLVLATIAVLLAFVGGYAVRAATMPEASETLGIQHSVEAAPKVVQTYLEALAAGDADTARSIAGASQSEKLLSNEVLKQSNELAPISGISVSKAKANGDDAEVSATFRVGETTVDRTFRLRNTSAGWQLADGLVPLSLSALAGFDPQLNGTEVDGTETRVFPGAYRLALGSSAFKLNADFGTVMIASQKQASEVRQLQPQLTEEAAARYGELVRAAIKECVALTDLVTPCGLDVSARLKDGSIPVEGSAKRSLDSEGEAALDALVVQMDPAAAGTVFSVLNIQVKTRLEAENNGSRVSGELLYGGQLLSPHVDFNAETPAVVWQ